MGPQSIRKQTLLQGWRKRMTGGNTFLLSLPETHNQSAALCAAQPDGKAAFLCKKRCEAASPPPRGTPGEQRARSSIPEVFLAPVCAKPRPVPEGGYCEEWRERRSRAITAEGAGGAG